jgi:hypothetical protein
MYVLILTLAIGTATPPAMSTAEFSSQQACFNAGNAWKMQAKFELGNVKLTTVCMPK